MRRKRVRFYWRANRGGYYADFRDFRDVGGGREALLSAATGRPTTDEVEAAELVKARLAALAAARTQGGTVCGPNWTLRTYMNRHLDDKQTERRASTVRRDRQALAHVLAFYAERGRADVLLADVTARDVEDFKRWRRGQTGVHAGMPVAAQTIQHELHAWGNLYKRARREGLVAVNPVTGTSKPRIERPEAEWLEPGEAARLLRFAAEMDARPTNRACPFLAPIIAAFLLTGGRWGEVMGLEVSDVDLKAERVRIWAQPLAPAQADQAQAHSAALAAARRDYHRLPRALAAHRSTLSGG
jgi:integrase